MLQNTRTHNKNTPKTFETQMKAIKTTYKKKTERVFTCTLIAIISTCGKLFKPLVQHFSGVYIRTACVMCVCVRARPDVSHIIYFVRPFTI